jgi:hypothetical protein
MFKGPSVPVRYQAAFDAGRNSLTNDGEEMGVSNQGKRFWSNNFFQNFTSFVEPLLMGDTSDTRSISSSSLDLHGIQQSARPSMRKFIIHPNHPKKIKWDLVVGLMVIYTVIVTPFRIGFRIESECQYD